MVGVAALAELRSIQPINLDAPITARQRRFGRFVRPVQEYIETETAGAVVLVLAALGALVWANSPWHESYEELLETVIAVDLAFWEVDGSFHFWVNEVAMVLFFFLVGLEIKREVTIGELADPHLVAAPIAGAIGGMLFPLVLFLAITNGTEERAGWAVPMATDIAFALGVAALAGPRVPAGLKAMLLTFAIVDDIGTVVVIAIFYSTDIDVSQLVLAGALVATMWGMYRVGFRPMILFLALGVAAWAAMLESGVHPTTLGVVLGLLTPWQTPFPLGGFVATADLLLDRFRRGGTAPGTQLGHDQIVDSLLSLEGLTRDAVPHVDRLEHELHPWVAYAVVPAFALANAGVHLRTSQLEEAVTGSVMWGVLVGLVIGKPVGLMLGTWIAVRLGAALPRGVTWPGVAAMGVVAGIGFTVALFVTDLAYSDPGLLLQSKVGILAASLLAGPAGFLALRSLARPAALE